MVVQCRRWIIGNDLGAVGGNRGGEMWASLAREGTRLPMILAGHYSTGSSSTELLIGDRVRIKCSNGLTNELQLLYSQWAVGINLLL
jgi:hypothetical protein